MLARRSKGYTSPDRCFNNHVCSILEGCQRLKVMQLKVNMRVLAQAANMTPEERVHATQFPASQLEVGEGTANDDGISIKLPPGTSANF
jgi:hypothetical protein